MYSLDNRHALAAPYWARPGIVSFARHNEGGGGGGDDEDDDDDDDDDPDDDDDDDPDEDKSEDELRAELKRVRGSLKTANGSSAKRRKRARDLQRQLDEARAGKGGKGGKAKDDDEVDVEAIKNAAKAEARTESDTRIKRSEGKAALLGAGVPADKVKRAVGLLDLADLDVDDDGEVDGLDDAVDALKDEWPELFAKPSARRRRESVAGDGDRNGERGDHASKTKSASQKQADGLLGRKSA